MSTRTENKWKEYKILKYIWCTLESDEVQDTRAHKVMYNEISFYLLDHSKSSIAFLIKKELSGVDTIMLKFSLVHKIKSKYFYLEPPHFTIQ